MNLISWDSCEQPILVYLLLQMFIIGQQSEIIFMMYNNMVYMHIYIYIYIFRYEINV